jgi:hypothetical protein
MADPGGTSDTRAIGCSLQEAVPQPTDIDKPTTPKPAVAPRRMRSLRGNFRSLKALPLYFTPNSMATGAEGCDAVFAHSSAWATVL